MEKLWITNIAPGTGDEELIALIKKYAPDLVCTRVQRIDGTGSRPAALLSFTLTELDALQNLSLRLEGLYWKGRTLSSSVSIFA